jgi:hypothetical protein
MFWIIAVAGWLIVAPLIAWLLGTAVAHADRDIASGSPDVSTAPQACSSVTGVQSEQQANLATAG